MTRKRRQASDYVTCKHCHKEFRAITVRHLRNVHDYDDEHPINKYKLRFRLKSAMCLEVRKRISETKESFWAKRGQHWTRARLLAEIRRARCLRRKEVPVRLYEAGRRFFGTWQGAVEQAGLDYEEATGVRRWSPEKVVEAIRQLAGSSVPLSASYAREHHPNLLNAAVKQFPCSWAKALRAAGFDADEHKMPRGRWSRQGAED